MGTPNLRALALADALRDDHDIHAPEDDQHRATVACRLLKAVDACAAPPSTVPVDRAVVSRTVARSARLPLPAYDVDPHVVEDYAALRLALTTPVPPAVPRG